MDLELNAGCSFKKLISKTLDVGLQESVHTNARTATKPLPSVVPWNRTLKRSTGYSNNMPTSNGEINFTFVKIVATQARPKTTCTCTSVTFILEVHL